MNYDLLVGEKRLEIIEMIAKKPSSPIEIAQNLAVTVSYVSQQLKLLEIAGVVNGKKTGLFEKGKPRKIYSVRKNFASILVINENNSFRKTIETDKSIAATLNILFLRQEYHYAVQRIFWNLDFEKRINAVLFDNKQDRIVFVSEEDLSKEIKEIIKKFKIKLDFEVISKEKILTQNRDFSLIYDPEEIMTKGEVKHE